MGIIIIITIRYRNTEILMCYRGIPSKGGKMPEKVLVCYTLDRFEETIAIADTMTEMSRYIGKTVANIGHSIKVNSPMNYKNKKVKVEWVNI